MTTVSEICVNAIRGIIVAESGSKLAVADLSNIEGRVAAWIAGEEWKLKAFRDYDRGVGHDLYLIGAGRILGKRPEDVTKLERQNEGKVPELAFQFGGAVGAFAKMSANFGIVMAEERIVELVKAWRRSHPAIVSMWYALEDAAKNAIRFPNDLFEVRGLRFDVQDHWLRIRMPSGSYLSYPNARVGSECLRCEGKGKALESGVVSSQARIIACPDCEGSGKADTQIWYDGVDQYTKKWGPISTYSGKIFENLVQKIARDVFMRGFRAAARAGYHVIARVHDELITEVPDDPRYTAEGLSAIMATNPPWAVGLPLAAAGHSMLRYSKQD